MYKIQFTLNAAKCLITSSVGNGFEMCSWNHWRARSNASSVKIRWPLPFGSPETQFQKVLSISAEVELFFGDIIWIAARGGRRGRRVGVCDWCWTRTCLGSLFAAYALMHRCLFVIFFRGTVKTRRHREMLIIEDMDWKTMDVDILI